MPVLRFIWRGWKAFAHVLGIVNRYVLLTVFYFVMINITSLVIRLFRIDLLDRRMRSKDSYWHERGTSSGTYQHQF